MQERAKLDNKEVPPPPRSYNLALPSIMHHQQKWLEARPSILLALPIKPYERTSVEQTREDRIYGDEIAVPMTKPAHAPSNKISFG